MRSIDDVDILVLPGWKDSEPNHFLLHWVQAFPNMRRVEQDDWENATYANWAARLSEYVERCSRPTFILAYSLGTSLTMRWAQEGNVGRVAGAFLVAPSDRDQNDTPDGPIQGFGPMLLGRLPFPSTVVASRDDPRVSFARAKSFADAWGSDFMDAGAVGHFDPRLGIWPQGLVMLGQFVASLTRGGSIALLAPEPR
jgi:predicted alpha/beta hydrolase family esterase